MEAHGPTVTPREGTRPTECECDICRLRKAGEDKARIDWLEADSLNPLRVVHNVCPGRFNSVRAFIDAAIAANS